MADEANNNSAETESAVATGIADGPIIDNPTQRFHTGAIQAVIQFRRSKPWRGTLEERFAKLEVLHEALKSAYPEMNGHRLAMADDVGQGFQNPSMFSITEEGNGRVLEMHFRLSVVTYFVGVGTIRSLPYIDAMKWALALYARMFPISAAKHETRGGFVVRRAGM